MSLIEEGLLKRILRRVTVPFSCRVVILMYHRVFETSSDPWELCVSPKHFTEQLELLRRHYQILSLHKLVRSLKDAQLPRHGVVLTFDDGYADNVWNAKPLLEKYDLPATFFVTSGSLDSFREFWWDDLERALLQPKKLPRSLKLQVQGRWHEWPTTNSDERQHAYMAIHRILNPLSVSDRNTVMTDLFAWVGDDRTGRPDYRPLTTTELIQLGQSELIDIGAHTVTHSLLSALSPADQFAEISGSREKLEDIIGRRVDTFSYPYGNFSAETVGIAAKAGFVAALTTESNAVKLGVNLLLLGRFGVGNWAAGTFRQRLDDFFRT